jgi:hypothetical protein
LLQYVRFVPKADNAELHASKPSWTPAVAWSKPQAFQQLFDSLPQAFFGNAVRDLELP